MYQRLRSLKNVLLALLILIAGRLLPCNVRPSFSFSVTHTCGLPSIVKVVNTSSGTLNSTSKYWLKANHRLISDTMIGIDSISIYLKHTGSNALKMYVKDTSGCIDSTTASTITVSTNAKTLLDQNSIYSYNPTWINCIQYITDPDTFSIRFSSADTLNKLRILWGDGSADTGQSDLIPNTVKSHLYTSLGIFTLKVITLNGSCTDTVYGTVVSQRQPTAGIIGPASGNNRGCVPHRLRIVNNSYNISNSTTFEIDWGIGPLLKLPYTSYRDTLYNTYTSGMCGGVIKITARNVCGNSVATWNPVDISDRDKALWTVSNTCDPTKSHVFFNVSNDRYCLLPDIKEYFWDFGDGTTVGWTSSKAAQSHIFKTEGDYLITLISKNGCGNDTFKARVPVFYNPVAGYKFNNSRGCLPLKVDFTDTSKGRAYTRTWTVTENGVSRTFTDSVFSYTFTKPGTHQVTLTVANKCASSSISRLFVVNDKPQARFAYIPPSCIPAKVSFTNTSTSYFNNPVYVWTFGDGTGSTQKNPPQKTYTVAGSYIIRLVLIDSCGSDTFTQTFVANGLPLAMLSGDTTGCTFDSLRFNNQSSLNANTFEWSFGDGQTMSSAQSGIMKHTYSTPGNFSIRMIAVSAANCRDTSFHSLVIKPGAKAIFDIDKLYACSPAKFKFTNRSVYGKDFKWYANGKLVASTSVLPDSLLNDDSTIIHLKLLVTSNSSCQDDSAEKVYFTPVNPKAVISNRDSGCGPLKVKFINASSNYIRSLWILGNGDSSELDQPFANYTSVLQGDKLYYPQLKVLNWAGCRDSAQTVIKVFPDPSAAFVADKLKGCGPLKSEFLSISETNGNDSFSTLRHSWYFGNGNNSSSANPSNVFYSSRSKDTFYNTTLKVTTLNGCSDTITKSIQVYPLPFIQFEPDKKEGCGVLNVHFKNKSIPNDTGNISWMNFIWDSGIQTKGSSTDFSASYGASAYSDTSYNILLVGLSEHGCRDSLVQEVTIHPDPHATFHTDKTEGCSPLSIGTKNLSVSKDGGILSHHWKFGNGQNSSDADDTIVFVNNKSTDSVFSIVCVATSKHGCKDTASSVIIVRPIPVARFIPSVTKACAPLLLKVTDASENAKTFYWGQNNILHNAGFSEVFRLPGLKLFDTVYKIAHQVISPYGCMSDTVFRDILVLGQPQADFEYSKDSFCSNDFVSISNNTLGGYKYLWNFGDNTTSTVINPKHQYRLNGNPGRDSVFSVRLIVSSYAGCMDTALKSLSVISKPTDKISLDKTAGCTDLSIQMMQKSVLFKTLYWDFGDNSNFMTADSVSHTYINQFDNLSMQPKIILYRQRFNCLDTNSVSVLIYPKPRAGFKAVRNDPCDAGVFQFINQSKNNLLNEWSVDDALSYTLPDLSLILSASKSRDTSYNVKLYIKNTYQCVDSSEQTIYVRQKQVIKFNTSPPVACENGKIDFINQSVGTVRNFWKFGDGGMSNEFSPSYVYNKYGEYNVKLYGYDKEGCVDSSDGSHMVKVLERPKPDFSYLPAIPKLPNAYVYFTAAPKINTVSPGNLIYDWDFGDKSYPTGNRNDQNPVHVYSTAGVILVKLTVWNQQCKDFIIKPVYIEDPKPEISFTPDTLEGCVPLKVRFKNRSTNVISYRWIFGDGAPDAYEKEPTHVFELPGVWDVTLIATGTGGVTTRTYQYLINTYPKPVVDFYAYKRAANLPNAVFNLENRSAGVVKNEWAVFDSLQQLVQTSVMSDPAFILPALGRYKVRLIGVNSYGCSDTVIKPDYLEVQQNSFVYTPNAFSPNRNGKNDAFRPSLYNIPSENYRFKIFNRWGEKLFETTNTEEEWDGEFNGSPCEQDTYIWVVFGQYVNGDLFSLKGTVTLLR